VQKLHGRLGVATPQLKDTGALMLDLAQHGITGARGVTVVQSAFSTLLGGGKPVDTMLKTLGVTLFDSKGKFLGMASVLSQLGPKLQGMTDQQRQLALATLAGASLVSSLVDPCGLDLQLRQVGFRFQLPRLSLTLRSFRGSLHRPSVISHEEPPSGPSRRSKPWLPFGRHAVAMPSSGWVSPAAARQSRRPRA
jgi:hypothetical protein